MSVKKYKIVIDARMINHSGIGTYIKNMIPTLVDNYKVILLGERKKLNLYSWSDKVKVVESTFPIYSVKEQIYLPFIIPSCDIFLSPHYNIPLLPIRSAKRIVIIHDVNHLVFRERLSVFQKIYANLMLNAAIKLSDIIFTVSEFSRKEIKKYIKTSDKEIKVMYPSIPKFSFEANTSAENLSKVKIKYNLPKGYLLYVGSIKPHKNFKNVVKAFELLIKDIPNQILAVVGISESELNQDVEVFNLITKNEMLKRSMVFTGYIDYEDMPLVYLGASALVFPSFYEGFGLPPFEAMASKCPAIVSETASLPEVCGDAVLYFDPYDHESIYVSIKMILTNRDIRNKLVENGSKNIDGFTSKIFAIEMQNILDNALNAQLN